MALTKVRLPVADIAAISFGTSDVTIPSAGGDINAVVAGVTIGTFNSNGLDLGSNDIDAGEATVLGVTATDGTVTIINQPNATEGNFGTTSAHPLNLLANNLEGITLETNGKVTLHEEGTDASHLVTKSYVDAVASVSDSDFDTNAAATGHFIIPGAVNDIIVNWGITASINSSNGATAVVFDEAFPTAFLSAQVSRNIASAGADEGCNWANGSTTGMDIYQTGSASSPVSYIAIGY